MSNTWVVIADSSRARIFTVDKPLSPLQELETLTHPQARLHEQDLTTDLPGRAFDSTGEGRHAMGQNTSPKEQESLKFAKRVADRLEAARIDGHYGKLVIAAAPRFLGQLRQHLSTTTTALIAQEIAKNLTQHPADEIRQHLPERL
jgi:protein required for attachment to host cells